MLSRHRNNHVEDRRDRMTSDHVRVTTAVAGIAALILAVVAASALQRDASAQPARNARRIIRPDKAPNTGLPFSPGVLAGDTLYVSGHLGRDPVTNALVGGGIEAETRQSLANIREVLRAAGMDFKDVTTVTAYITSFNDFPKFNAVYREIFPNDQPARATVQVAALNDGAHVELQMIAVKR
jgi:2-iminobutanoate/2-iminopropanoate deaminase